MRTIRLRIGEVARRFGLRDSALRYYERHHLLTPPRDRTGQRHYRESDLRDLAFVLMCRDGGLQLHEIATMMGRGDSAQRPWQEMVAGRIELIEAEIARLQHARDYLQNALRCTADHPAVKCPYVQQELTDRVTRALA
jgi:MerR family transcriptional regulator, copper efflux regulator